MSTIRRKFVLDQYAYEMLSNWFKDYQKVLRNFGLIDKKKIKMFQTITEGHLSVLKNMIRRTSSRHMIQESTWNPETDNTSDQLDELKGFIEEWT